MNGKCKKQKLAWKMHAQELAQENEDLLENLNGNALWLFEKKKRIGRK
jgi:hypothetical protein